MKEEKTNIIFLDIDGVLNGYSDHSARVDITKKLKDHSLSDKEKEALTITLKLLYPSAKIDFNGKKEDIGFISRQKTDKLKSIVEKYNVKVVGISSWFIIKSKEDQTEHNKNWIKNFFGFEINEFVGMADPDQRLSQCYKYLKQKFETKEFDLKNFKAIYLDDDNGFSFNIEKIKEMHKEMKLMNVNFIHPQGAYGLLDPDYKKIESIFSEN